MELAQRNSLLFKKKKKKVSNKLLSSTFSTTDFIENLERLPKCISVLLKGLSTFCKYLGLSVQPISRTSGIESATNISDIQLHTALPKNGCSDFIL